MITAAHFWARIYDEQTVKSFEMIQSILNSRDTESLQELNTVPNIGSLVMVPQNLSEKIEYYRGIVRNVVMELKSESLAEVLMIDVGTVDRVRVCDLRKLDDGHEIASIPGLAFECVLAGIRPSGISRVPGQWSEVATKTLTKLLGGKKSLFGEVYSVVDGIVRLNLMSVQEGKQLNLNQHLIELGYAEAKQEDYQSRCNHELRTSETILPDCQRQYYEELQYSSGFVNDRYPELPDPKDCPTSVKLRGPYSPLEIQLASLTTAGLSKRVGIDEMSVNSVLLDTNLDDPHERLLVAASVTQNSSGHRLNLRNTTLMPNIPGLTSLLSLIFSPRIELRRNKTSTRYIGALCGLGYHPLTKYSLFPEHDLTIHFDVNITMDDLQEVSRLKKMIFLYFSPLLPWEIVSPSFSGPFVSSTLEFYSIFVFIFFIYTQNNSTIPSEQS